MCGQFLHRQQKEPVDFINDPSFELLRHALPQDDPRKRKPDIRKANQVLGWQPLVSLKEGLQKTIAYFDYHLGNGQNRPTANPHHKVPVGIIAN